MSRPIKLTDEVVEQLTAEFKNELTKTKVFDGRINYSKAITCSGDTPEIDVVFTTRAYTQMLALVMTFDEEIAWHGTVVRKHNTFYIVNIYVYPQTVTGTTVTTDVEEYSAWLYKFDDDVFNAMRFQGHSHVNMSTTPSSVDLTHQAGILSQLNDDDYYIFAIWNKKMDYTIKIFDLATNTLYENNDINVYVGDESINIDDFVRDAKQQVKHTKSYSKKYTSKSGNYISQFDW